MQAAAIHSRAIQLDPRDNLLIALADLQPGEEVECAGGTWRLAAPVPAKHKFAASDLAAGDVVRMYGVTVGRSRIAISRGERITTQNLRHEAEPYHIPTIPYQWTAPDVAPWRSKTFPGYRRPNGRFGTRNYWIVAPLVFCENRNLALLREAFEQELGFAAEPVYRRHVAEYARLLRDGRAAEIAQAGPSERATPSRARLFPNVDGIKFLTHETGCGGTREDSNNLCALLAGYICHPNVAGATVLSLGCQHAEVEILRREILRRDSALAKPLHVFEQQAFGSESAMMTEAVRQTFFGLMEANRALREPAPLSSLCIGLKCGGSDGFSGISANPAVGHVADLVATLGGAGILSEFPELCGVEQHLIDRSSRPEIAQRFIDLMHDYAGRAKAVNSGFEMNPSPGNIRDGLITDAMKSAGAARKGGASPVNAVLDYPEWVTSPGLNLLCTPGNDVECVTAQVAAGANLVLFTTGLGTPTGNPIAPVIKISSNSALKERMNDIIDFDAGNIITGEASIKEAGEALLDFAIRVAGGERTRSELSSQDNFIPWKRGVSL
jgi:altronate hydrolase